VSRRAAAGVLTLLTVLFFARVAGQALVALSGLSWLPPMSAWYSGLLPYRFLLPTQILILAAQVAIDWQVLRGAGFFALPHPRLGHALRGFAWVYAFAMLVRWLVTGTHGIPIVFHWVLAGYLFTLGRFCARDDARRAQGLALIAAAPRTRTRRRDRPWPPMRLSGGRTPRAGDR
jgi:hypothetical protein